MLLLDEDRLLSARLLIPKLLKLALNRRTGEEEATVDTGPKGGEAFNWLLPGIMVGRGPTGEGAAFSLGESKAV